MQQAMLISHLTWANWAWDGRAYLLQLLGVGSEGALHISLNSSLSCVRVHYTVCKATWHNILPPLSVFILSERRQIRGLRSGSDLGCESLGKWETLGKWESLGRWERRMGLKSAQGTEASWVLSLLSHPISISSQSNYSLELLQLLCLSLKPVAKDIMHLTFRTVYCLLSCINQGRKQRLKVSNW